MDDDIIIVRKSDLARGFYENSADNRIDKPFINLSALVEKMKKEDCGAPCHCPKYDYPTLDGLMKRIRRRSKWFK